MPTSAPADQMPPRVPAGPGVSDAQQATDDAVAAAARLQGRLASARLYLCTDGRSRQGDFADFVRAAYAGGVDIIQLRDKTLEAAEELELLSVLAAAATEAGALWSVNDRADIAAASRAPILHLGQKDLPVPAARALVPAAAVGLSCHTPAQLSSAASDPGVDYFCVGPLWATPTKPGRAAVGLDLVRAAAASGTTKPWFAIGGIDLARVDDVVDAGARRIVVVRAITEAADPAEAARALRQRLA
jgi:thiamine-phosphate pyrophosphorylase